MTQEILFRYFRGEASAEEQRQIGAWLLSGEDAQREFEQAHFIYEGMVLYGGSRKPAAKKALMYRLRYWGRRLSYAAILAAAMVLTGLGVRYFTTESLSHEMMALQTQPGQRADIELSDGTVVTLNSGSRIEYPTTFKGRERRVRIEGEALLKVNHDERHPFVVSTYAADVKVLGTTFDVVACEEEERFETILMEGSVQVTSASDPSDVQLMKPGDMVTFAGGRLQRSAADFSRSLGWLDGLVSLEAKDFKDLMNTFERVYGVQIVTTANPSIHGLSGEIRISEGIDHALKVLQHVIDFEYEIYEGTVIIR